MTESSMEQNPTTAGLKVMKELLTEFDKQLRGTTNPYEFYLQRMSTAIRNTYGDLSDIQVMNVCAALQELAKCDKCTGYPCQKGGTGKGFKPVVRVDARWGLSIASARCKTYSDHFRQEALARKFKQAKIPTCYKGKTLADYRVDSCNKDAVTFAKTLLQAGYRGAYFYGDVGTGKTLLAAIIAQEFLNTGKSVLFEKVADLLTEFYAIYRGRGGSEDNLLDELYNVDLLVLDDFGIEKSTQFVGATLCKILDARYNREDVTTLITSNYTLEQIKRRLNNPTDLQSGDLCLNGSRIYDRCREICKPILFKGESRRS